MRRLILLALWMMVCVPLGAQTTHRDSLIVRSRYLRSVLRTDEAIGLLSTLVSPERMDVDILSELADCHFQSGHYEEAALLYDMLSLQNPGNLLFKLRNMQIFYRVKAWRQTVEAGKEVLALDTIPAVLG